MVLDHDYDDDLSDDDDDQDADDDADLSDNLPFQVTAVRQTEDTPQFHALSGNKHSHVWGGRETFLGLGKCILSLVMNIHMYVGVGRHFMGAGQNCNIFVSHIYFKYVFMYVQIVHCAS